jgi:hypothetical protein
MMNAGEKVSGEETYVDSQLKAQIEKIENQLITFKLDKVTFDAEAERYLVLSEDEIMKLTPMELAIGEYKLSTLAVAIQSYNNKAYAIKNWATRMLDTIVAKSRSNYNQYAKWTEVREYVMREDSYAKRLGTVLNEYSTKLDSFYDLAQSVQKVSMTLGNLARIRKYGKNDTI